MMIFSLVVMIGLEKCCITSACLQWLCHSGERTMAHGPLVNIIIMKFDQNVCCCAGWGVGGGRCLKIENSKVSFIASVIHEQESNLHPAYSS